MKESPRKRQIFQSGPACDEDYVITEKNSHREAEWDDKGDSHTCHPDKRGGEQSDPCRQWNICLASECVLRASMNDANNSTFDSYRHWAIYGLLGIMLRPCWSSDSVNSRRTLTCGVSPVTTPFATSNAFVTNDDLDTIYVAVLAFTMMIPIRYKSDTCSQLELLDHLDHRRVCRHPNLQARLSMLVSSIYGLCFYLCLVQHCRLLRPILPTC